MKIVVFVVCKPLYSEVGHLTNTMPLVYIGPILHEKIATTIVLDHLKIYVFILHAETRMI